MKNAIHRFRLSDGSSVWIKIDEIISFRKAMIDGLRIDSGWIEIQLSTSLIYVIEGKPDQLQEVLNGEFASAD